VPAPKQRFTFAMDGNTVSATGADRSSIVNGVIQKVADQFSSDMQKDHTFYLQPRPSIDYQVATGYDNLGRGSVYWPQTGQSYHVVGERVYRIDSSYTVTEVTAGGNRFGIGSATTDDDYECRAKAVEMKNGTAYYIFQISKFDGTDWTTSETWHMTSGHVITKITDAQFPSNAQPGLAELDGYLFVISSKGEIYNSDLNSPVNWTGDFISSPRQADRGTTIARHLNYVVSFNDRSIEFFYDAGNASGSPLARVDGAFLNVGTQSPHSLCPFSGGTAFVARSFDGNYYVGLLDGMTVKKISSDYVDYVLSTLTLAQVKQIYAYTMTVNGTDLYVMQLPGASCTLVLNIDTRTWTFWSNGTITTRFPMTSYCNWQLAGNQYGVGLAATASSAFSGKELFRVMNQCTDEVASGSSTDLVIQVITDNTNFGVPNNKFLDNLSMLFDFPTTSDSHDFILSTSLDQGKTFVTRETKTVTGVDELEGHMAWWKLGRFKNIVLKFRFELNSTSAGTSHKFYEYYPSVRLGGFGA
jgi:Phage stabilisation protein